MNKTPNANRVHIAVFGKRNAGKSSLLNAIVGQEISLVSDIKGTTTDPVYKAMELLPLGPVLFIDTAGLDDEGTLGALRVKRTEKIYERTDFAIYVTDINDIDDDEFEKAKRNFKRFNIPFIRVFNKCDDEQNDHIEGLKAKYKDVIFVSTIISYNIDALKDELVKRIQDSSEEQPLVGDLIPYSGKVVMVVPIDSEAPKGRLILPQVQLIRDCLDHGIKSYVVRDTELESALDDLKDADLVVTDSQAFKSVDRIVPKRIPLTSFSILFARHKGNLEVFVKGVRSIDKLPDNANILICESCSHNTSHEDIGSVKIPRLLKKYTGKDLNFDFKAGHDFPTDIEKYHLIIHCGACMMNRKSMTTRIMYCEEKNIPITNFGVTLAFLNGILDRSIEIFDFKGAER